MGTGRAPGRPLLWQEAVCAGPAKPTACLDERRDEPMGAEGGAGASTAQAAQRAIGVRTGSAERTTW